MTGQAKDEEEEDCRHAVNSFGDMLSRCLAPLCRLILSLSLWNFGVDVAPL